MIGFISGFQICNTFTENFPSANSWSFKALIHLGIELIYINAMLIPCAPFKHAALLNSMQSRSDYLISLSVCSNKSNDT